jgi:hypothetical protein
MSLKTIAPFEEHSPMKDRSSGNEGEIRPDGSRRIGIGTWIVVAVLLGLLVASGVVAYLGWTLEDADVPASGYIAMAFGVVFSLAVGIGLMALVFYSSRKGYDEPAVLVRENGADGDDVEKTPGESVK